MMKQHTITFDWRNLKSVKRAETKKMHLENLGYNMVGTTQVGLDRFKMTYQKSMRRK